MCTDLLPSWFDWTLARFKLALPINQDRNPGMGERVQKTRKDSGYSLRNS
jgi:hypothetical protein